MILAEATVVLILASHLEKPGCRVDLRSLVAFQFSRTNNLDRDAKAPRGRDFCLIPQIPTPDFSTPWGVCLVLL